MRVCLYSPYIPKHFGGGERYLFKVAQALGNSHQVEVAISATDPLTSDQVAQYRQNYSRFLGSSLDVVGFIASPLGTQTSFFRKLDWTRKYDLLYYVTDGSLFFSAAKNNVLHIQIPFTNRKTSVLERLKLKNWSVKNANSQFTQNVVEKAWQTSVPFVHYPVIEEDCFQHAPKKQKVILSVGRFFQHTHAKRQDLLIKIFQKMLQSNPELMADWRLVLIGGIEDQEYVSQLYQLAKDLPITFLHDVARSQLLEWYAKASIYWHAAGFEVNEAEAPEKVEHFGISTGEAMASGCIPVVVGKGGQTEVVGAEFTAYLWQTENECLELTTKLITDTQLCTSLREMARAQVRQFSQDRFEKTLQQMIKR